MAWYNIGIVDVKFGNFAISHLRRDRFPKRAIGMLCISVQQDCSFRRPPEHIPWEELRTEREAKHV
jgi:hypothetical protein